MNQIQPAKEGYIIIGRRNRSTQKANVWYLTKVEMAVTKCICQGQSSEETAKQLSMRRRTFDCHLRNIYQKVLGERAVRDRAALIIEVLHNPTARAYCFPELQIEDR